jgi:hypothetical protein
MHVVTYSCPLCLAQAEAPILAISPGEIGIWQCEGCERAFRVQIEFRPVTDEELQTRRETFGAAAVAIWQEPASPEEDDEVRAELIAARLLEVDREMRRLRSALENLEHEAQSLEQQQQSS